MSIVSAAPVLWTGAGGNDNWSTAGNWSGGTPAGNEVIFGDSDPTGVSGPFGTANNIVDGNLAISRLSYTNLTTVGFHTTQISPGVTLQVTNNGNTVLVYAPTADGAAEVYATVLGGGTLTLSNTAGLMHVGQGSATVNANRRATLDLSGLQNFNATLGRIILAQQTVVGNRANATVLLAQTNVVELTQASPTAALLLGEMSSNNGNSQILGLGFTNAILSDAGMTVGGRKGNGTVKFNEVMVGSGQGVALFRNRAGTGRQANWFIGDNIAQSGGNSSGVGLVDFSVYGTVDALVDNMILGRGTAGAASGTGQSLGTLTFDAGIVDVNNLSLGIQPNAGGGVSRGVVNVNGTGHLIVNGNVLMGRYVSGIYMSVGVMNIGTISGGAITINGDVICGGGVGNAINLFGELTLGGKLGDLVDATNTPLETLDLWAGTLTFDRGTDGNPFGALASVTNLNVNGPVAVNVQGVNLSIGQFPLIKYYSGFGDVGGASGFAGLTLTLPNKVEGYLSNNTANASVDVVITNISGTKWSGVVNANWDINNTANWVTTPAGTAVKYLEPSVPGDAVLFDDTATGTTVNLTTTISPGGIVVSNATKIFTFNGAGRLSGPTGIIKRGAATLVVSNSGSNDFADVINIENGKVQIAGSSDRLPTTGAVTLADAAAAQLDLNNLNQTLGVLNGGGGTGGNVLLGSGNLTVSAGDGSFAGVINGTGAVIKDGTGAQVLAGANLYSGGTRVVAGTLAVANTTGSGTGSGSVTVESTNATLRIGDGGANGSVAASVITNHGLVVINRSDDINFTTGITGNGAVRKENTLNIVTIPISNTYTGATTVAAGGLRISTAGALGDLTGQTSILNDPTARLELTGNITLFEPLSISQKQNAAGNVPGLLNVSGTNTLAGPIELPGGGSFWTIQSAAGKLIVSGVTTNNNTTNVRTLWLSGAGEGEWNTGLTDGPGSTGAIRKDGTGTWKIGGSVTYTGSTVVSNGTLLVNGAIIGSSSVTVAGGTLGGNGALSVPVTVNAAGNLAPGDAGIGKLSVFNNLTLTGTTTMELAKTGPTVTNDQVSVLTTLTQGGTLDVSLTGTVVGGEVFQLLTAGTFNGAFDVFNLPTLPGALTWDTSNLAVNGTLAISSGAPTLGVSQSGNVLTFSWAGAGLKLQAQTNSLNVGLSNNWFDYPGGETSGVSATINPANAAVFFRLISQ
jgi:fibronectin-binding autotransporter adhesin